MDTLLRTPGEHPRKKPPSSLLEFLQRFVANPKAIFSAAPEKKPEAAAPAEAPAPFVPNSVPFAPNTTQQQNLGITARELEILALVARGLSNREIANQLFVSENTVKTHCARAFDKPEAVRRTQAVQRGKELGLLP